MADVIHFLIHCLWAAVALSALAGCRTWLTLRLESDVLPRKALEEGLKETAKTVIWLKAELEKLRAIPRTTPRL